MAVLSIGGVGAGRHRASKRMRFAHGDRRTFWESLLWGAAPEHCAECGVTVDASRAIRHSARQVYCSIDHARLDLDG